MLEQSHFSIGISYSYEDVSIVKNVVDALKSVGLSVFFDQDEKALLVGKNLTYCLQEIYVNNCDYCLMFVSKSYAKKKWSSYEREWLLHKRTENLKDDIYTDIVIPVFIDDIVLAGLNPGIVGFDVRKQTPSEIANIMYKKIFGKEPNFKGISLSITDVFIKLCTDINNYCNAQTDYTYQVKKISEYDTAFILICAQYKYYIRLLLEQQLSNALIKLYHGTEHIAQVESTWDAEVYYIGQQLYYINYGFSVDFPGIPHLYTIDELSNLLKNKIDCFVKEHLYV